MATVTAFWYYLRQQERGNVLEHITEMFTGQRSPECSLGMSTFFSDILLACVYLCHSLTSSSSHLKLGVADWGYQGILGLGTLKQNFQALHSDSFCVSSFVFLLKCGQAQVPYQGTVEIRQDDADGAGHVPRDT